MYTLLIGYGVIFSKYLNAVSFGIHNGISLGIEERREPTDIRTDERVPEKTVVYHASPHTAPRFSITHQYSMLPHSSRNSMPHFA